MNKDSCIYCCEFFNQGRRLPIKLECGHIICNDCVDEIKFYLANCPIDNTRANFKSVEVDQSLKNKLGSFCKLHQYVIIGYCETHLEIICQKCSLSHMGCKVWKGSSNQISERLDQSYENSVLAILQFIQYYNYDIEEVAENLASITTECKAKISQFQEFFLNIKKATPEVLLFFLQKFVTIINKNALQDCKSLVVMLSNSNNQLKFAPYLERMCPEAIEPSINEKTLNQSFEFFKDLISLYLPFTMNSIVVNHSTLVSQRFLATISLVNEVYLNFNMIGLSRPSIPNGLNSVINLEITCQNRTLIKLLNIEVSYLKEKFFYMLILPEKLEIHSQIEMLLEVKGTAYYLFTDPVFSNIAKMEIINEHQFKQAFPVCIIGFDNNPEVLKIVNDSNFA